jgi:hypothetical protein
MWGTEASGDVSRHAGDRLVGPVDLVSHLAGPGEMEFLVRVGVIADLLLCQGYDCGSGRVALDMLADHEEGCGSAMAVKYLEDALGHSGVRSIVKREIYDWLPGSPADHWSEYRAVRGVRSPDSGTEQEACTGSTEF